MLKRVYGEFKRLGWDSDTYDFDEKDDMEINELHRGSDLERDDHDVHENLTGRGLCKEFRDILFPGNELPKQIITEDFGENGMLRVCGTIYTTRTRHRVIKTMLAQISGKTMIHGTKICQNSC
ncbi:hypothetical protein EVAR_100695_1 [Eumeta japonica]|uniref:Uncharacterized protein n=1 Tax=Eumeta variegata TaxID=151549 RepID=A0A4C1SZ65_EUMVA|nr:hypothetical protein EVAR_100695_1 [Eumeta japonica]